MRHRTKGQSLVEMALILPILLIVIFGIIDMSWYVYSYATIYQAARNGAEKATMLPPTTNRVGATRAPDRSDQNCVGSIMKQIQDVAPLFSDLTGTNPNYVFISYPTTRAVGEQIEVRINYTLRPLTPLWEFVPLGTNGTFPVTVVTRRSIEVLGANPQNRFSPNLTACN